MTAYIKATIYVFKSLFIAGDGRKTRILQSINPTGQDLPKAVQLNGSVALQWNSRAAAHEFSLSFCLQTCFNEETKIIVWR